MPLLLFSIPRRRARPELLSVRSWRRRRCLNHRWAPRPCPGDTPRALLREMRSLGAGSRSCPDVAKPAVDYFCPCAVYLVFRTSMVVLEPYHDASNPVVSHRPFFPLFLASFASSTRQSGCTRRCPPWLEAEAPTFLSLSPGTLLCTPASRRFCCLSSAQQHTHTCCTTTRFESQSPEASRTSDRKSVV